VTVIDGLRGLAATLVVLFHLHGAVSRSASDWLWRPVDWMARQGYLGVDIFFVISGFVIALSVSKGAPTLSYLGRFILRRSIRLDPPYWSSILLEALLLALSLRFVAGVAVTLPTTPQLVAHLFYAQELLGYGSVVNIYWTLCYEIQFYLGFVGIMVLAGRLPERLRRPGGAALAVLLFVVSLWTRYVAPGVLPHGLALDRWFQFFLGVLTWRVVSRRSPPVVLAGAWLALAVTVLATGAPLLQLLPIFLSGWVLLAVRDARWGWVLTRRPVQFLGAISYSMYLYHSSIGWRFVSLVQRLVPGQWPAATAVTVYLAGIAVSLGIAALLWWCIERPCLAWCHRIRLPRNTAGDPVPAQGVVPA
jgi:peptidoglycan/LPS O-acetylase OafA/YrhL